MSTLTPGRILPGGDRVRAQTRPEVNRQIDDELERRLRFYERQDKRAISDRLEDLDREWDIERVLETNAASVSLLGLALGALAHRRWFFLPMVVSGFLLQHAIQGWCPPLPFFRRLGFRTCTEIEQERHALKALRGDLDDVERERSGTVSPAVQLAQAVRA